MVPVGTLSGLSMLGLRQDDGEAGGSLGGPCGLDGGARRGVPVEDTELKLVFPDVHARYKLNIYDTDVLC